MREKDGKWLGREDSNPRHSDPESLQSPLKPAPRAGFLLICAKCRRNSTHTSTRNRLVVSQIWHRISKASEGRPGTAEPASPTPLLTERKRLRGGTLFWGYNQQRAVRQRPWKISFRATGLDPEQLALFNLANNLDEKDDPPAAEAERLKVMMAALAAR